MIYFQLIFVTLHTLCLDLFFWHMNIQFLQHLLLKRFSLFHFIAFALLSKMSWLYVCRSISGVSILFCGSTCLYFYQYHTVLIALIYTVVKWGSASSLTFSFSFNIEVAHLRILPLCINFGISLSISPHKKNLARILIGIVLNLQIKLGRTDTLTTLNLSIHEHGVSFHLFTSPLIYFIRIF